MNEKSGFTLIELSIVLVIIGLIIGSILTGQDLINSAAIRAQIAQIEKYNTAVHTFQGKYGGLPGDLQLTLASQFGFPTTNYCNGTTGGRDGNGIIDGYYSSAPYYMMEYGEATLLWQDLSYANLIDGTFPNGGGSLTGGCGIVAANATLSPGANYIGDYLPVAKIGQGNFVYAYDSATINGGIDNNNWYGISAVTSIQIDGAMLSKPAISVMQAYNIDQKIDDGNPHSGAVRAKYINNYLIGQANPQASDSATSCYNTTTYTYSISINGGAGMNCALSFRLQ